MIKFLPREGRFLGARIKTQVRDPSSGRCEEQLQRAEKELNLDLYTCAQQAGNTLLLCSLS